MENHQKNRAGNQIIFDYISRRYRYPKDQASLVYLSQLNQAYSMQFAVEHFRRIAPRCMGALYWQLTDCWPAASWSSIEFTGRWKAAHHAARRFFAPALVSARLIDEETVTIGNYRKPSSGQVHLYTVYDAPRPASATLRWELRSLDGPCLAHGEKRVRLRHGESRLRKKLDYKKHLAAPGAAARLYLRALLLVDGEIASESTLLFTTPRFMALRKSATRVAVRRVRPGEFALRFLSPAYQHGFAFDFGDIVADAGDNYFDLHPGEPKTVRVSTAPSISRARLRKALTCRSLVDSYQ
jgi:beta-mannosidase